MDLLAVKVERDLQSLASHGIYPTSAKQYADGLYALECIAAANQMETHRENFLAYGKSTAHARIWGKEMEATSIIEELNKQD